MATRVHFGCVLWSPWLISGHCESRLPPLVMDVLRAFRIRCNSQLLEQYAEQVSWQSEIRHEAIRFPPMDKMIVDYQVSGLVR